MNFIRLFSLADEHQASFSPEVLRQVRSNFRLIDDNLRANQTANRLFMKLLTDSRDPEAVLRKMNEAGVLGRFIPDFGRVVSMMQFNMYHHFTVVVHVELHHRHDAAEIRDEAAERARLGSSSAASLPDRAKSVSSFMNRRSELARRASSIRPLEAPHGAAPPARMTPDAHPPREQTDEIHRVLGEGLLADGVDAAIRRCGGAWRGGSGTSNVSRAGPLPS